MSDNRDLIEVVAEFTKIAVKAEGTPAQTIAVGTALAIVGIGYYACKEVGNKLLEWTR